MRIELKSAGLHAHLEEAFGLPTPTDDRMVEIFGLYHTTYNDNEGPKFWCFDPLTQTWDVNEDDRRPRPEGLLDGLNPEDERDLSETLSHLDMMERPPLPRDLTARTESDAFIYSGWIFAWYFFPELRRWELAPVKKR